METFITTDQIEQLVADTELDEDAFFAYSGRGMYGKTCFALKGDEDALFELGVSMGKLSMREDWASDLLGEMRAYGSLMDSLGRGSVFYWQHIGYGEPEED